VILGREMYNMCCSTLRGAAHLSSCGKHYQTSHARIFRQPLALD
jgi:uncharacterized membrane protein